MACRSKRPLAVVLSVFLLTGCLSLRVLSAREGADVADPASRFRAGESGLGEVLTAYGAPTEVHNLGGEMLLVYERMHYRGGEVTMGIPLSDVLSPSFNLSGHGDLIRYDTAAFFFRSRDRVLTRTAFVRGSAHPFWDTFWSDSPEGPSSNNENRTAADRVN